MFYLPLSCKGHVLAAIAAPAPVIDALRNMLATPVASPWSRLILVIEPLYPPSGRVGSQPIGVPRMLRMYCLHQWYGLAKKALEDVAYDSLTLRDFVGDDLSHESVPDATTLPKFRRLLLSNESG